MIKLDRKLILGKFKKIETTGIDIQTGEPLPQNKLDAINYYNESLRNLVFSNEDIARIKLKKAKSLDPDLKEAAELFEELKEEPAIADVPKTGISIVRFKVDYGKILTILTSVALIVFLIWAFVTNMKNSAGNKSVVQSQVAFRTLPKVTQEVDTTATVVTTATGQIIQTTGAYAEFASKLNDAKTFSDTGDHIKAMKSVNEVKSYSFNTQDAAKLSGIINTSRRAASYSSYYLGVDEMNAGKLSEAIAYIDDSLTFGGIDENLEWVEYLDAKLYYMDARYPVAKIKFNEFMVKYPNSFYKNEINNFLTEIGSK